jgi:hypothetical protein
MLTLALLAVVTGGGNAPADLKGKTLDYHITKASGDFASDQGTEAVTVFTADGKYTDTRVGMGLSDMGTYEYTVIDPNHAKVVYHIDNKNSPWPGADYYEDLDFETPTSGKAVGHATENEHGTYRGTFTVTSTEGK